MAKSMFKPDAALDGQEFSAITRLIEALHARKEVGVDEDALESAKTAKLALDANGPVGTEDLENLLKCAKAYEAGVKDDKLEQFPNVKGMELKRVVQKLEGMLAQQETELDGKKVHPAAMPAGEEPEKAPKTEPAMNVAIVETPEMRKEAEAKQKEFSDKEAEVKKK